MPSHAAAGYVWDVWDGISRACVFGKRTIIQIDPACSVVDGHVFQDRAEAPGGLVNLRFALGGEPDDFGIAGPSGRCQGSIGLVFASSLLFQIPFSLGWFFLFQFNLVTDRTERSSESGWSIPDSARS